MPQPVPAVFLYGICVPSPIHTHPADANVQMCASEILPIFMIGPSTFFPIAGSGLWERRSCWNPGTAWQGL